MAQDGITMGWPHKQKYLGLTSISRNRSHWVAVIKVEPSCSIFIIGQKEYTKRGGTIAETIPGES